MSEDNKLPFNVIANSPILPFSFASFIDSSNLFLF
nr:MAG TPA: hypothetical protein [Caudoviricetes sp.]